MKKIIGYSLFILILLFGAWFWWSFYYTYSDGNRSGLLQKASHKGNVFKTYEGELVLNSLLNSTTAGPLSTEKFFFSVDNKQLGEKMREWEGKRVVVRYKEKKGSLPWRGDTRYIVDSIRVVE